MNIDAEAVIFVGNILYYSTILPFLISWIRFKLPPSLQTLRIVFPVSFIATYCNDFFAENYQNNLFVGLIYVTMEYLLYSRIFWLELTDEKIKRYIKYSSMGLFVFAVINLAFIQGFLNDNSVTRSTISFITITYSVIYFWSILNSLQIQDLYRHPMFWINCGILLYASGSFVLFLVSGHLHATKNYEPFMIFWAFKNFLGIIRNLFFAYAFWLNFKQEDGSERLSPS